MKPTITTPPSVWKNPIHFLAFGFGSGAMPIAPGTAGSVVGVGFFVLLHSLSLLSYLIVVVLLFAVGCYLCDVTEKAVGVEDHPGIVWDEIVGYLVTMIAVPYTWYCLISGFILFRVFDIFKPWPVKLGEQYFSGGLAVMIDDVIAGIYAWIIIQLGLFLFG